MKLSNKVYDVLKWLCITVSPATIALITGLGMIYDFPADKITGTIALITTFVGALIGVSSTKYSEEKGE